MLTDAWIQLIGYPPIGYEFLPYIFGSLFLFLICKFVVDTLVHIYTMFLN